MSKRIAFLGLLMTTAFLSAAPGGFDFSGRKVPFEITYILPKLTPSVCDSQPASEKACCLSYLSGSTDHSMCNGACPAGLDPAVKACCDASHDPAATKDSVNAACVGTVGASPGTVTDALVVECHCDNPKDEAHQCSKDGIPCCFSTTTDPATKKEMGTPFTCELRSNSDPSSDSSAFKSQLTSKSITTIPWNQVDGTHNVETGAPLTGVTALKSSTVPDIAYHGRLTPPADPKGERIGISATAGGTTSSPGYIITSYGVQGGGCTCNMRASNDPIRTWENLRDLALVLASASLLWYATRRRLMRVRRARRVHTRSSR